MERSEIEKIYDHYDESRAKYKKSGSCQGGSHLEYYRDKHPEKYKALIKDIEQ